VIQAAQRHRLPVRCVWVSTAIEDAQVNAATRIVARYGRLPGPEELKTAARTDVAAFPPTVQFRYQRELEPPDRSEGFSRVDVIPFERTRDPSFRNRAVILWCDGVLHRSRAGHRTPRSPDDVDVAGERGAVLRRYADDGWIDGRLRELTGVDIAVEYCPHPAGPPVCWCRKPLPGLGVVFLHRYRLDPTRCIYVGAGPQDPGFARRLGFQYREAEGFFGGQPPLG
jgi:hypothetical protein